MTAKEYLSQVYHLDIDIKSMVDEVVSLHELATNVTGTIRDMPGNPNKGNSTMADAVEKIVDLEMKINKQIDDLVNLRTEIELTIQKMPDVDEKLVLRRRYLNNMKWNEIAAELGVSYRTAQRIHVSALKNFENCA